MNDFVQHALVVECYLYTILKVSYKAAGINYYRIMWVNVQLYILYDDHYILIETIFIVDSSIIDIAYTMFSFRTRRIMPMLFIYNT